MNSKLTEHIMQLLASPNDWTFYRHTHRGIWCSYVQKENVQITFNSGFWLRINGHEPEISRADSKLLAETAEPLAAKLQGEHDARERAWEHERLLAGKSVGFLARWWAGFWKIGLS